MTRDGDDNLENEILREQYVSLRDEAIGRIRARRRLIAAALAFFAAFLGYAFAVSGGGGQNGSLNRPNVWLLAIVPPLIAFLAFEIFRSEKQLGRINTHLEKIEQKALADVQEYGWEFTVGGGSERLKRIVIFVIASIYVITSIIGYKSWSSAPLNNITLTTLLPASGFEWILVIFYLVTGVVTLILIVSFLGDNNESDGVLFDRYDKKAVKGKRKCNERHRGHVSTRIDTLEDEVEVLEEHDEELYDELQSKICADDPTENGGDHEDELPDDPD